ncbi:carbohydrate ABC transporter permease [Streptomyces flavofungini]|uniref:Sugar ABC transporter permease n=1 Tax=Streptomyces flavofungini TaxID=68200 RepID=A0ABS0X1Q6_9ACTN|nr:sugar ABC transporter permease [Streptomyces flavofungini]MBJ3807118.1 sugar ABC transporter permease [Streptomyces flavofungini]GHC74893.1 sugar ABC transporter permease [Streptomyces flavofungini]
MSLFPATAAAKSAGRRAPRTAARPVRRGQRAAYGFIAPLGIGFGVFYFWPMIQTFYFSFTEFGPFGGHTWTGTDNYARVLRDVTVWQALGNTLIYCGIGLVALPLAIVVAALLNRRGLRGVAVYRALYFVPFVTLPVAVGLVWNWLYNGDFGLLNEILGWFGVDRHYWVSDPSTAVLAIGAVMVWSTTGYYLIIFMAGIKSIPRDYYEAAELDGAGPVRRFFTITLPLLSPTLFFASVICMIQSLQTFDLIFIMMGEKNPAVGETQSVVGLFYTWAFIENAQGAAAALAFLLMLLIAGLTYLQFRLQRKWVHYG